MWKMTLKDGVRISMDGKSRWLGDVYVKKKQSNFSGSFLFTCRKSFRPLP